MPNRIIRAELLESEAWLALKDNVDRVAYVACLLTADVFGDMPAGPHRLVKLWRAYGIDTPQKAAKVMSDLADVDLIRTYQIDDKPYLHLPRYGQSVRFLGHVWPLSPWATSEEKHRLARKSPELHMRAPVILREAPVEVDVEVDVDEKLKHLLSGKPDLAGPTPTGSTLKAKRASAVALLAFLNERTGRKFPPTEANVKLIVARLAEGFTEQDIRSVIANRCRAWKADDKMAEYLRPKTLFGATNFSNYFGEIGKETPQ